MVSVARPKRQDALLQQGDREIADRDSGLPQEVFDKMIVRCQVSGVRCTLLISTKGRGGRRIKKFHRRAHTHTYSKVQMGMVESGKELCE